MTKTTTALLLGLVLLAGCGGAKRKERGDRLARGIGWTNSFSVTTVTSGTGGGAVTVDPPGLTHVPPGTSITVTAAPDAFSYFAGWGGDLTGQTQNPVSLVPGRDLTIVGRFELPRPGSPRAAFTTAPDPPSGAAPFSVTFTDASSDSPTGWSWTFGDGQVATGRVVAHTYAQLGLFTVGLQASNASGPGLPARREKLVVVVDRARGSPFWFVDETAGRPLKSHTPTEAALVAQVLALVNQERAAAGLAALLADAQAERAAKAHCEDMAGRRYFDHISPEGWTPGDRLRLTGASGYSAWGENIARGPTTASAVMQTWMASPGHRANILDPSFTHLGVGLDEQSFLWAQVFVRR